MFVPCSLFARIRPARRLAYPAGIGNAAIRRTMLPKSRWEIENQSFNAAKNRYGFEGICHYERHSLLVVWLLTCLALTIERLQ